MTELIIRLEDVSRNIWQVFGEYDSWKSDSAKCQNIHQKLLHFNKNHSPDLDHIDYICHLQIPDFSKKSGILF